MHGDPIVPGEIVEGTSQQSFLDARMRGHEEVDDEPPQPAAEGPSYSPERLPPVPEEESDIWQISPEIFGEVPDGEEEGEDIREDAGDLGETPSSAASRGTTRRRPASSAAGPSVQGLESRSQSHLEIREDHQVRLQHHMAECSKQFGRFAAFDPTTCGKSFAACRARSFDNCYLKDGFYLPYLRPGYNMAITRLTGHIT